MEYLSNQQGNDYIADHLSNDKHLSVGRLGIIELNSVYSVLSYNSISNSLAYLLQNNAGVYGKDLNSFIMEYLSCLPKCNTQVYWQDDNVIQQQEYVLSHLCSLSTKISHRSVEPFYFDNPWSQHLKDKKILVVSPFIESIISQYNNRNNLWDNPLILPSFDLIPYKNVQSINNSGPHSDWYESLSIMKQEISNLKFDIALLGCGAYGLPLVSFISDTMKKSAIYIGGALQILFGIKGKRWDDHDQISKMYKPCWIRPSSKETPPLSNNIENGCYW